MMRHICRTSVFIIILINLCWTMAGCACSAVPQSANDVPDPEGMAKLIEGDQEAKDGNWEKASEAYSVALKSKNLGVRTTAQERYVQARERMRRWHWPLLRYAPVRWALRHWAIIVVGILLVALVVTRKYNRRRLIIEPPTKVSKDAPVEIFAVALAASAEVIRQIYDYEGKRWSAGFDVRKIADPKLVALTPHTDFFLDLAGSVPDIGGIDLSRILKSIRSILRFLDWRVESGVAVAPNGDVTGYAVIRWAWLGRGLWIESLAATSPRSQPGSARPIASEPEATARLREVAWRLASDILGSHLIR